MTIKQLLDMPIGEENRTGGFELTVRTARRYRDVGTRRIQEVVLEDGTGQITADLLLPKKGTVKYPISVIKSSILKIIICWLQPGKDGSKMLYVDLFMVKTEVGDPGDYYASREKSYSDDFQYGEPLHIIKSKVKMHVVCAILSTGNDYKEEYVNKAVDFIVGE